jgi:hypothetical protein
VESRDLVQARARIGGTIVTLDVEEGSSAQAGAVIARVVDDKLALHMGALDARLKELDAEMLNASAELERGRSLFASGTIAKSRLDTCKPGWMCDKPDCWPNRDGQWSCSRGGKVMCWRRRRAVCCPCQLPGLSGHARRNHRPHCQQRLF